MNTASKLLTVREINHSINEAAPFPVKCLRPHCETLWFAKLVNFIQPALTVELGTGDGFTAAQVAAALPRMGEFHTINWPNPPSGDDVGRYLREHYAEDVITMRRIQSTWTREEFVRQYQTTIVGKVVQHYADTTDVLVTTEVPNGIDLLIIDSTHTLEHVRREWLVWSPKLADGAIVLLDDVHFADGRIEEFWDALPYDKLDGIAWGGMGMFRYVKDHPEVF